MLSPRVVAALTLIAAIPTREAWAQRPLPSALADPQVARALAAVDAGRHASARWLATIGGIVSPSGGERERAEVGWHVQPADDEDRPYWRLPAAFLPPLLRSAAVRKFVVGYELSAEPQRDFSPEEAAERLPGMPETSRGSADPVGLR